MIKRVIGKLTRIDVQHFAYNDLANVTYSDTQNYSYTLNGAATYGDKDQFVHESSQYKQMTYGEDLRLSQEITLQNERGLQGWDELRNEIGLNHSVWSDVSDTLADLRALLIEKKNDQIVGAGQDCHTHKYMSHFESK
jgi:hypothetical protein